MKQNQLLVGSYISKFMQALQEAGQQDIDDEAKMRYVQDGLRYAIKDRLVNYCTPDTFDEFCEIIAEIEFKLEELKPRKVFVGSLRNSADLPRTWHRQKAASDDAMDWEPTAAA
ncbi:hypothetical protein KEM52_004825, partial [Ascosphaera acerosa]